MPRPKRAKVASGVPASRVASFTQMSQTTTIPAANPRTRRNVSKGNQRSSAPAEEDEKEVRPAAKRPRAVEDTAAVAGAVDRLKRRKTGASNNVRQTRQHERPVVIDVERSQPVPAPAVSSSPRDVEAPRRQARAPSAELQGARQTTPLATHMSSANDLYDLSPQGEKSQLKLQQRIDARRTSYAQSLVPSSQPRAHPTPMMEASLLALKNFKRRTRQPSILRTGRMSMQSTTQLDLGSDLDNFNPDDESTPLHLDKYTTDAEAEDTEALRASSSPRRLLSELSADKGSPQSSPPLEPQIDEAIELMKDTIDLAQGHSSVPSSDAPDLPEYVPETVHNTQDDAEKEWSETMAPPKSSSSLEDEVVAQEVEHAEAARSTRARRGRHASVNAQTAAVAGNKSRRPPVLSTAHLQSLLPQRRIRRPRRTKPDSFEVPSDSDAGSDDELTPGEDSPEPRKKAQAGRRATSTKRVQPDASARKARLATKSKSRTPLTPSRQNTQKQPMRSRLGKTYGRLSGAPDKENEEESVFDLDDGSSSADDHKESRKGGKLTAKQTEELKGVKDKFAEIDDWEMEFESVDASFDGSNWR